MCCFLSRQAPQHSCERIFTNVAYQRTPLRKLLLRSPTRNEESSGQPRSHPHPTAYGAAFGHTTTQQSSSSDSRDPLHVDVLQRGPSLQQNTRHKKTQPTSSFPPHSRLKQQHTQEAALQPTLDHQPQAIGCCLPGSLERRLSTARTLCVP